MAPHEIYQYWNQKAEDFKTDPSATMRDVILRSLEIEAIGERLQPKDVLLDVGTGNAFGVLQWAKRCRRVMATDYSTKMIEKAREAIAISGFSNIQAETADVLDLHVYEEQFTAASSVRCLINLTNEEDQYLALIQMAKTLRPGGRLFLIEGLAETFESMNEMRKKVKLQPIQLHWHNLLLARDKLEAALSDLFTIDERVDFGEYYFLSRIVHPLLVSPAEPTFDGQLNLVARTIWQQGAARGLFAFMSTLMLYVCRRR